MRPSEWTPEEREREERVREIRARQSREQTPEERLEETLRVSRLISELREGLPTHLRARRTVIDPSLRPLEMNRMSTAEALEMCGSGWDGDLDEHRAGWRVI
jgi:hypothetical protein